MIPITNKAELWSTVLVDELWRAGMECCVVAPGSRSTPLTLAFYNQNRIKIYSLIDERSAAFFALGLALANSNPVGLVCTSGTALANFYPAVVEAFHSRVPLILLTADRSHELRESGTNQTINQVNMYGDYVRWFVDVAPPEANAPPIVIRYLRTLACRAVGHAAGLIPGPVHLNIPFRKPLEPVVVQGDIPPYLEGSDSLEGVGRANEQAFTRVEAGNVHLSDMQLTRLASEIKNASMGLIVCGPGSPQGDFHQAVAELAAVTGFPILADPLSGLRTSALKELGFILGGYETFLPAAGKAGIQPPDFILQFGDLPVSKSLLDSLASWKNAVRVSIHQYGAWADDAHLLNQSYWADPCDVCMKLGSLLRETFSSVKPHPYLEIEEQTWRLLSELEKNVWWEGLILKDVVDLLPEHTNLFISNSLPVRHLDQFVQPICKQIRIFGNRGASGIDGITSTALGIAAGRSTPTVLVTGDLAFYHDLNGLLAIKRTGVQIIIVLINNNGGGIFTRLPISNIEPPFTDLFLTPHGLDFSPVGQLYGIRYQQTENRDKFKDALNNALTSKISHIIEVKTDVLSNELNRKKLNELLHEKLSKKL